MRGDAERQANMLLAVTPDSFIPASTASSRAPIVSPIGSLLTSGLEPVQLVEVDVVGTEAAQAVIERVVKIARSEVMRRRLGGDEDPLP